MMLRTWSKCCVLVIAVIVCLLEPLHAQPPQSWVTVEHARLQPYTQTQQFVGQVISNEAGVIASEVSGRVMQVKVKVGDHVKAGDILAEIDTARLEIEVNLAKARVQEQEATVKAQSLLLQQAELNLKRQKRLVDTPAYSKADLEDREISLANVKAELLAREAELARYKAEYTLANLNLERAQIRTLYAGIVTEKKVQPGAYISEGSDIAVVVNEKALEIEVNVPRKLLSAIQDRKTIDILVNNQRSTTQLRAIVMSENILSRTISLRLVPDAKLIDGLIPNQSVEVFIPLAENKTVLTISKDALINRKGQFFVFVIEDNKAVIKEVSLGNPIGARFEIVQGVKEGDLVVIRGNERLQPGQAVQYKVNHNGDAQ